MLSLLWKSLSGESTEGIDTNTASSSTQKAGKRNHSGDSHGNVDQPSNSQKKKKFIKDEHIDEDEEFSDGDHVDATSHQTPLKAPSLPAETPNWGIKLLEIIQGQFKSVCKQISSVETKTNKTSKDIKQMEKRLAWVEDQNCFLENENKDLKEKLLDTEYHQKINNLIFEGIRDQKDETDSQCSTKVWGCLRNIPDLDTDDFKINKCFRLDGPYHKNTNRRVLSTFNCYQDSQKVLHHQKNLPRGVFIHEDFPEEWVNHRKVLKPLFNAAKWIETLKYKTHLSKDKLIIDGKVYSTSNVMDANSFIDIPATCQRTDSDKIVFLGIHSIFSNFYQTDLTVNNVKYSSDEQFIQSEKAALFNDDLTHAKIMHESNPYKNEKTRFQSQALQQRKVEPKCQEDCIQNGHCKIHPKFNPSWYSGEYWWCSDSRKFDWHLLGNWFTSTWSACFGQKCMEKQGRRNEWNPQQSLTTIKEEAVDPAPSLIMLYYDSHDKLLQHEREH